MTGHPSTTSESPACVDPQGHNPVQPESTKDDADKEREDEFSHECRLRARWINIAISFGVELHDVFKVGMRLNIFMDNATEDDDSDSDMDDDEKAVYSTAYKNIIQFIPGLKKFLPINRDGDCEKLSSYIEKVQRGCNAARSDTFKRINQFTDKYLNSGTRPIQCDTRTMPKTARGLNHPQMGRLIIPAEHVAEWDKSLEASRAAFNSGDKQIMGYDMPVFLYDEYKYDNKDPDKGLFQSAFLVCVLIDILYGPQAVDTEGAKRNEHHRHHCVADMYDAETITPQMIAYSAVVARFALSSRRVWNYKEDNFDYRTFYRAVIMRLTDPSDPWAEETIKWWNVRVFGNEEGKIITMNKDNREREEWQKFVERKAARKARNTAALSETPGNEDVGSAVHNTPASSPLLPGIDPALLTSHPSDAVASRAGVDSAVHNTPASSPLPPVIDPALLTSHPSDAVVSRAGVDSAVHNTPPSSPLPPVIDPALLTSHPSDAVPSCAGVGDTAHSTLRSSPLPPIVDPALLTSHQSNSVLTQTHHPMATPPNPNTTSNPEREQSPLSNPPDEETSTGSTEIISAPPSCRRKRKSATNNTGKGKAPPKQRRKTASQYSTQV